jgi:hypothetical protein
VWLGNLGKWRKQLAPASLSSSNHANEGLDWWLAQRDCHGSALNDRSSEHRQECLCHWGRDSLTSSLSFRADRAAVSLGIRTVFLGGPSVAPTYDNSFFRWRQWDCGNGIRCSWGRVSLRSARDLNTERTEKMLHLRDGEGAEKRVQGLAWKASAVPAGLVVCGRRGLEDLHAETGRLTGSGSYKVGTFIYKSGTPREVPA